MNKLDALEANTDGKVVDYVTEAIRVSVADQQVEAQKLQDRMNRIQVQIEGLTARVAELQAGSNSASADDKYSLTKAKVVRLMKENGWYD